MNQEPIILFSGVEILPNIDKQYAIEYLKRYCTVDDLGDTIYAKKLGNNKTTFAIDFDYDEISIVRKIKDENGNNIEKIIFDGGNQCCGTSQYCKVCECHDDENDCGCDCHENNKTPDDLIVCPKCNTKCETEYYLSETEYIPIYSECSKCGWSVC